MKAIKGFENYLLSNDGVIINSRTGRVLKINKNTKGYSSIMLSKNGRSSTKTIHRLVYENFIGSIDDGLEINHIDGDKSNNNINNLELVTKKENMIKAVEIGLIKSGAECERSVKVLQMNPMDLSVINEFGSINIASRETKVHASAISLASRGIRRTAGGFVWKIIN